MFTKAEIFAQAGGVFPFTMKGCWAGGAKVPIAIKNQSELDHHVDKNEPGLPSFLGWELVSSSNLFGIPAINSQKYFQQQQQPLVPQQIMQSAQQIQASGLGYAPTYYLDDSHWDYAVLPAVPDAEKTECNCDFRGPNAWLGCRCGFLKGQE